MNTMHIIAAALAAAPPAGDVAAQEVKNVWDFIVAGGIMMIPIGICSLIALGVIVERLISLQRRQIIPPDFLAGLKKTLSERPVDAKKALKYCEANASPVASIFAAGIKRLGAPLEVMEKHIQDAGEREVIKLRKFLRVLKVIAAITPLMGLLGTIFGMIKAFQTVAMAGETLGMAEPLAKGIYEAMVTTAAGLTVAIPVLICYHVIAARIDAMVMEMDQMSVEFLEDYANGGAPVARAEAAASTGNELDTPPDAKVVTA